ncbi:MAG: hypothetical protein Q9159_007135 [Coniocarpon cinnabarinum]
MSQLIKVATCALDQWVLDLHGNFARIVSAVNRAKAKGARILITPELSIPSYGLLDHWHERDWGDLFWEVLAKLLASQDCFGIVLDVGMPIEHRSVLYNCRIWMYNGRVLFIRPKMVLANDGNFREARYFTPWSQHLLSEDFILPQCVQDISGQERTVIGDVVLETRDHPPVTVGLEMCEELFTPGARHVNQAMDGVDIICNSSGSHHELRKLNKRVELVVAASAMSKSAYMYSNLQGCDADRLYYDGTAMICVNGQMVSQGSQFSLQDVEVLTATVDLEQIRSARFAPSWRTKAQSQPLYPRVMVDASLTYSHQDVLLHHFTPTPPILVTYFEPEEEIALGPAAWLWDYLRRSRQTGFFLCLSGGIDSCATAVIVFSMCRMVFKAISAGNEQVLQDLRRIAGEPEESAWKPSTPQDVCSRILHTAYMGTSNSGGDTRARAKALSQAIGSYHLDFSFDAIVSAFTTIVHSLFGLTMRYNTQGGTSAESLALQNIQARSRMVLAYLLASILPQVRQQRGDRTRITGGILVLGSSNVDEALRGYFTKYDASSADLNPIGSISKLDLRKFIAWAKMNFDLPQLQTFMDATPSAELIPLSPSDAQTAIQSDEDEMGISYAELSAFGQLRKNERLGPWGQFLRLCQMWGGRLSPREVYSKVRHFNWYYNINRHKMTTLTPSYHAESYSCEDNRFDMRPFLYPSFDWVWEKIERTVGILEQKRNER